MRVLHIITGLDTGGAELMLYRLTQELPGVQHFVISLTSMGSVADRLTKAGVTVRALNLRPGNLLRSFFRLYSSCRSINPHVVQTWMVHSDLLGGLAARLAGVRSLVWGVRTTDYSVESHSTRLVRWLCARLSRVVPARIVCAAHASLLNSQAAGYAAAKLMVIPNGFDVARLSKHLCAGEPIRRTLGLNRDTCVVGCLGRYNPAKDHANFVAAAGLLADRFPHVRFLMVGRGLDEANQALMQHIESTGFPERFVLLGERSDPAACLNAMDVFVLSSCTEGFPNVLGEAMAMGLPCVSTDAGDAAMLMGSREWVVPVRDSKALSDRLAQLLALPLQVRLEMGAQARQRVVEQFSMSATAAQFMNLYTSLATAKP